MRRSMFLYLGGVVLVAPHMTAQAANVVGGILLVLATYLAWMGD